MGQWRRWIMAGLMLLLGLLLSYRYVPLERLSVADHLRGFPDADPRSHGLRPLVLSAMFFLPFFGCMAYSCAGVLSRWLTREFLRSFLICYGGILLVFMLIDFSGNASRFSDGDGVLEGAWFFYSRMATPILCVLLPLGTLLSALFCVSRVSRSREIVAALQSGQGMTRLMMPVYFCGAMLALFYMGCNFHWAPRAEGMRWANLNQASGKASIQATNIVFYYPKGRRMWMVKEFPREYAKGAPLRGVEVTTQNVDGSLQSRLYAKQAQWIESNQSWSFTGVELSDHHRNEAPIFVKPPSPCIMEDWGETPAQIIKLGVDVRNLSVPDLMDLMRSDMSAEWQGRDPVRYATQWHYRWAQPLSCLVYVILAVPLSLFVTRRASGGGLAVAIGLAILMVVMTTVLLALGESNNMSPALAVWSPVALFSVVGVCLMKRRISGRPLWPLFG